MQNLTGSSVVLFLSFYVACFGKKKWIWKLYLWTFLKFLDDIKPIFEPIGLTFGIYSLYMHSKQIVRFFEIFIFQNFIE